MNRPNIDIQEAAEYLSSAPQTVAAAIDRLVKAGRITRKEADAYIAKAVVQPPGSVYVIAIRGYYRDTMGKPGQNDRGIYDDAFILIGPGYFKTFNANTDNRQHGAGKAMLLPGWHVFKPGWHGYGKASGHAAFRTANAREVLPVLRDGQNGIKDGITINLHSGGQISTNSDGCQTVVKDQWSQFKREADELLAKNGQKTLPYLLLEP